MIHGHGAYCCDAAVLHSRFHGIPLATVEEQLDPSVTGHGRAIDGRYGRGSIWSLDATARKWITIRKPEGGKPVAATRGMGGTVCCLPDLGKIVWYVAAQNVSPPAYEMWLWDAVTNAWTELKPNGGRSISDLVNVDKVAPGSELQSD